jgi:hypothetical protein
VLHPSARLKQQQPLLKGQQCWHVVPHKVPAGGAETRARLLAATSSQLRRSQQRLQAATAALVGVQHREATSALHLAATQQQLVVSKAANADLEQQLSAARLALQQQGATHKQELAAALARTAAAQQVLGEVASSKAVVELALDLTEGQLAGERMQAVSTATKFRAQLQASKHQHQQAQQHMQTLAPLLTAQHATISSLETRNAALSKQLEQARASAAATADQLQQAQRELHAAKAALLEQREATSAAASRLEASQQDAQQAGAAHAATTAELAATQTALQEACTQGAATAAELYVCRQQVQQLRTTAAAVAAATTKAQTWQAGRATAAVQHRRHLETGAAAAAATNAALQQQLAQLVREQQAAAQEAAATASAMALLQHRTAAAEEELFAHQCAVLAAAQGAGGCDGQEEPEAEWFDAREAFEEKDDEEAADCIVWVHLTAGSSSGKTAA